MNSRARFTHMQDGQAEDWAIIAQDFAAYAAQLPARISTTCVCSTAISVAFRWTA
jgi:hypothetical protein